MTIVGKNTQAPPEIDPAVLDYIDRIVSSRVAEQVAAAGKKTPLPEVKGQGDETARTAERATLVVFSGDMDKLMASLVIATGAALMGMKVSMYFAFWGLTALKKKTVYKNKSVAEKLMSLAMPAGLNRLGLSKMNAMGMGPAFFKYVMKKKSISTLPELMSLAKEMGIRMIACQMSMDVMGISREEMLDGLDYGGVTTYLADARDSKITLFI